MKGFVVYKMCFIFFYFIVLMLDIKEEISNPYWGSFIRGCSAAVCFLALIKDIVEVAKKKDDD